MVIQTWTWQIFSQKWILWGSSLQGKQLTVFVANDKIQAFKSELEFGENCICHCELDSLPIFNDFSNDIPMVILMNVIFKY